MVDIKEVQNNILFWYWVMPKLVNKVANISVLLSSIIIYPHLKYSLLDNLILKRKVGQIL